MIQVRKIAHASYQIPELDKQVEYYTDILGLTLTAKELANEVGVATPLLDCLIDIYRQAVPSIGERDVAAILEFFESQPQGRRAG